MCVYVKYIYNWYKSNKHIVSFFAVLVDNFLFTLCTDSYVTKHSKGLLHGYEWGLRFGGLELRFG